MPWGAAHLPVCARGAAPLSQAQWPVWTRGSAARGSGPLGTKSVTGAQLLPWLWARREDHPRGQGPAAASCQLSRLSNSASLNSQPIPTHQGPCPSQSSHCRHVSFHSESCGCLSHLGKAGGRAAQILDLSPSPRGQHLDPLLHTRMGVASAASGVLAAPTLPSPLLLAALVLPDQHGCLPALLGRRLSMAQALRGGSMLTKCFLEHTHALSGRDHCGPES